MEVSRSRLEVSWARQGFLHSARAGVASCCLGQPDFCFCTAVVQHHVRLFYFFKSFKLLRHGKPKHEGEWEGSPKYCPLPCKANKASISLPLNMGICSPALMEMSDGSELNALGTNRESEKEKTLRHQKIDELLYLRKGLVKQRILIFQSVSFIYNQGSPIKAGQTENSIFS